MTSTRRAESCELVNSTVLGIWCGRWVLVWADGPRALTWEVHCALMVATDTGGWGAIVVWRNDRADAIEGSVGDVVKASLVQETKPGQVRAK